MSALNSSDALNVSLVGRLHRTVFVEGCNPNFYDELAMLFARKAGSIEARGMVGARYAVVFETMNSVSNAVALHGMSFIDLSTKLLIWGADKAPPAEATQLTLAGPSGGQASETGKDDGKRPELSEARKQRIEAFLKLGGGADASCKTAEEVTAKERQVMLLRLCVRQMKALSVIMDFDRKRLTSQKESTIKTMAITEGLIERLRSSSQQ